MNTETKIILMVAFFVVAFFMGSYVQLHGGFGFKWNASSFSTLGSLLGGVGAIATALIALSASNTWKKQFHYQRKEVFLSEYKKRLIEYEKSVLDFCFLIDYGFKIQFLNPDKGSSYIVDEYSNILERISTHEEVASNLKDSEISLLSLGLSIDAGLESEIFYLETDVSTCIFLIRNIIDQTLNGKHGEYLNTFIDEFFDCNIMKSEGTDDVHKTIDLIRSYRHEISL